MGAGCQFGAFEMQCCNPRTPHTPWYRKEKGLKKSKQGVENRGLFTAGEDGRGRGVWEDSDQLHADLQGWPQTKTSACSGLLAGGGLWVQAVEFGWVLIVTDISSGHRSHIQTHAVVIDICGVSIF